MESLTQWQTAAAYIRKLLRDMLAYKLEGDMVTYLCENMGSDFVRGHERSSYDAGICICGGKILAIDMKTMAMGLEKSRERNERQWVARLFCKPRQALCDVFCIAFPLHADQDWWALHPRLALRGDRDTLLRFYYSEKGHWINNTIPPTMWPLMVRREEALQLLQTLRHQPVDPVQAKAIEHPHGTSSVSHKHTKKVVPRSKAPQDRPVREYYLAGNTTMDLTCQSDKTFPTILRLLQIGLSHDTGYTASSTKYQPYTADFCIHREDGKAVFVEAKVGCCTLATECPGSDGMIEISHNVANPNDGIPTFVCTSARWSYFFSTIDSGHFIFDGIRIPKQAIFLHRNHIPSSVWNQDAKCTARITFKVPAACLIDMEGDFQRSMMTIMSLGPDYPFRLPSLETPREMSQKTLSFLASTIQATAGISATESALADELDDVEHGLEALIEKTHYPNYRYQAKACQQFLRLCRTRKEGTIFDCWVNAVNCRPFAFTNIQWSSGDVQRWLENPRHNPIDMFALPKTQPFLLFSFGIARSCFSAPTVFVHPFVLDTLHDDMKERPEMYRRRIVVFRANDYVTSRTDVWPIYAIPASAIDCDDAVANHSRWRMLVLRDNTPLHKYRFNNIEHLIAYSTRLLSDHEQMPQAWVTFKDWEVMVSTRGEIDMEINEDCTVWIESLRAKCMAMNGDL